MDKDVVPTLEQQVTLASEAQERMKARARSWLEDKKVKTVLQHFKPENTDQREAG